MAVQKEKNTMSIGKSKKRLVLLDAHAILHRAYHALPDFSSAKGEPTGALYGLSAMFIKILGDLKPDYIVACYDMPGPTFRHEAYKEYKAKRPKAEDDLVAQIKRSRDIFTALNVPFYEKAGFEADDLLGTIVKAVSKELKNGTLEVVIASGDMDTLQLVDDSRVLVYTLKKGINDTILYDEKNVLKRFGFLPKLLPDYKGLRGDPSDNIIGVMGIGEKTATALIREFGTIENVYEQLKKDPKKFAQMGFKERVVNLLREGEEEAFFSKTLAQIRTDAPIDFSIPTAAWKESFSIDKISVLFRDLGFRTLFDRIQNLFSTETKSSLREKEKNESPEEIKKIGIALWLIDSTITNPTQEDILHFANAPSFAQAKDFILEKLKEQNLLKIYYEIELPLCPILKETEERGIIIDVSHLKKLSKKYHESLERFKKSIFKEAGAEFNINSPRQLGEVLFDRLGLYARGLKKTEGGARSTRESELLKLRGSHKIIDLILKYREFQKLLSTYVDNMPTMLDKEKRLHTTFVQTGTTTGRFSSINPNLQNIPIRGKSGKEIRRAFVARPGHTLAAFDYSQIELRTLAILSKDKDLENIFKKGKDIHAAVAAEVFGVSEGDVNEEMRRKAKVINFGIIYGMGVSSLERALETSRAEAQVFYDNYWNGFPGVASYIKQAKKDAARDGNTKTFFGRTRYFEGIHSQIPYIRAAAERMAINAPIQGTAADIIKIAMIAVYGMLAREKLLNSVHLLLQVHDELVYEVEDGIIGTVTPKIKDTMENVIKSSIPLLVSVSMGKNWGEMRKMGSE